MVDAALASIPHIGTDEAGKGDYFGPLVVAAVYADELALIRLPQVGIRDSKRVADSALRQREEMVREMCPEHEVVLISPTKYNELYRKIGNLNRLLAWAHARAIESLLSRVQAEVAVADKFGDESYLEHSLMARGRRVRLVQEVQAEADPAVAAASILARAAFLRSLRGLSGRVGVKLPKGATHVLPAARQVFAKGGLALLGEVAKVHFRTTKQVVG